MALQFFEGFDNDPKSRISIEGTQEARAIAGGRNGTDGWTLTGDDWMTIPVFPSVGGAGKLLFGFAIKIATYPDSLTNSFIDFNTAFERTQGFIMDSGGVLALRLLNTNVATASAAIPLDTWTYVEVEYTPHDSTGVAKVWFDGVLVMDFSGDTRYNTSTVAAIFLGCDHISFECVIDDLYVADGTGTSHNARLGDVHVKRLAPSGAGNYSQGLGSDGNSVDNHLLVDEAPADSADYVALANGNRESYTVPNLAAGEVPLAAKVASLVGDGGGSATVDGFLRIGGVDYDAAENLATSMGYRWRDFIFATNPATGVAWAEDDLDGAEFGVRRTA